MGPSSRAAAFQQSPDGHDVGRKENGFDRGRLLGNAFDRIGAALKAGLGLDGQAGILSEAEFTDAGQKSVAALSRAIVVAKRQADKGDATVAEPAEMDGHRFGRIEVRVADAKVDRALDQISDLEVGTPMLEIRLLAFRVCWVLCSISPQTRWARNEVIAFSSFSR